MSDQTTSDVIVIGAGPVGMCAALTLAHSGVSVTVLEAEDTPSVRSHASTFHSPTVEILTGLGVGEELVAQGRRVDRLQYYDWTYGRLAEFDFGILAEDTSYPFRLQIEQRVYTRLAYERLTRFDNAAVLFNSRVTGVETDGNGAGVTVHANGRTHRARWLIAADGAKSVVRTGLGIPFEGSTYELRYLTVKTDEELDQILPGIAPVTYVSGGTEGVGLLALPDHWRVAFRVQPDEDAEAAMDSGRIQQRLRETVSDKLDRYSVIGSFIYFVHRRVAATFRSGPILLAGDSAHVNSPSGGMGMNSGIHDAYVFGTLISRILAGESTDAELSAAAEQRRTIADQVIGARSDQNYRDIVETDEERRAERRRQLAATEADPAASREYLLRASMLDHAPRFGAVR